MKIVRKKFSKALNWYTTEVLVYHIYKNNDYSKHIASPLRNCWVYLESDEGNCGSQYYTATVPITT
jgi:hypothetical protein